MTKKYYKYEETHRKVNGRKQKYCTKCNEWKGESEFSIDRSNKDGLDIRCRDCARVYTQARYRKSRKRKMVIGYLRFKDRHRVIKRVRQKLCTKCGKWKKEIEYYKNSAEKDGLMCRCKKCIYNPAKKSRKRRKPGLRPEQLIDPVTSIELGIQENDLWIAAQAITRNLTLITSDKLCRIREVAGDNLHIKDWTT